MKRDLKEKASRQFDYWPWLLGVAVLISRALTTGPVYFVDGPDHIDAIKTRTFVIQPPGYWLFNRTAGLFSDPVRAIVVMNWVFSVAGVVTFYYLCRLFVRPAMAKLGSAVYGAIFYAWFSGDVHSTYASQLFFPVLLFLFLSLHRRKPRAIYLCGASITFAVGAGFRPSDGIFLGVMFVYYLFRYVRGGRAISWLVLTTSLCLGWVLPTLAVYRSTGGIAPLVQYAGGLVSPVSMLRVGITYRSAANLLRFLLPLAVALWSLIWVVAKSLRDLRDERVKLLWLWVLPGACFFVLLYIADAPYLNYLTPALLLLALLELDVRPGKWGHAALCACLASNLALFVLFVPVPSRGLACNVFNVYIGKYTRYAVRHHWQPTLSSLHDRTAPWGKRPVLP